MTLPSKLREQVEARANGLCEYCQTSSRIVITMEVDHVVPRSAGGSDDLSNLCLTWQRGFDIDSFLNSDDKNKSY